MVLFAGAAVFLEGATGQALVHGLKLVACAVVAHAVWGMSRKLCPDVPRQVIAFAAAALMLFGSSAWAQILVIILAAIAGVLIIKGSLASDVGDPIRLPYGARS